MLQYLIQNHEYEKEEETKLRETTYELVVAIANQGSIDVAMDGKKRKSRRRYGYPCQRYGYGKCKEIPWGISGGGKRNYLYCDKNRRKKDIMKAIMEKAGLDSKEKAIVFSPPVTSVAGLRMREEDITD